MTLEKINSKRRKITILSVTLTILIVALYAFLIVFYNGFVWLIILGLFAVLALLYCLSKFLVYKTYLKLKVDVIELALKKKFKAEKITINNSKNDFIEHFYAKSLVNIKSSYDINYHTNEKIRIIEFEVTQKRNFKSNKVILAGKILDTNIDSNDDCVMILNYHSETNKFLQYYGDSYQNKKDYSLKNSNNQYVCLYNDNLNTNYLQIFERYNNFNMMALKDGKLSVLFIDKMQIFDFKLQKNIDNNIIKLCEACNENTIKIVNELRKVIKG